LCASFECENCYSIQVRKIDAIEKNNGHLKILLRVNVVCGFHRSLKKNMPGDYLSGTGGDCVSIGKKGKKMKMPPVPQMNIQQGDVIYRAYIENPRKKLSLKYQQSPDIYWKVRFVCQDNPSNDVILAQKIDAVLVGECSD